MNFFFWRKKPKVLVGMSGGVDSSVTALMLQQQGYEVIGGFMKNWSENDEGEECSWRVERRDALRVAAHLGIPFHTFDFEEQYREKVYEYLVREYEAGRTPNPDVLCNKYMKFDLFLQAADDLGCAFVATGHYARVRRGRDGVTHLLAVVDGTKDQSYFLCQLQQHQLARVLFPVGGLRKTKVRKSAERAGLAVAAKPDSQGICFVGEVALRQFLGTRIAERPGKIVHVDGRVVGEHRGIAFYTIGQREGLNIGGQPEPLYVVERRVATNEVVVAPNDHPARFRTELRATDCTETVPGNWAKYEGKKLQARVRYRQPLGECRVARLGPGEIRVTFMEPQRAVAPGQFVAVYAGVELIGSGVIA
jgi:tRNA-specific 2-thiouridylase